MRKFIQKCVLSIISSLFCLPAIAEIQTFVREYHYQASEADSKLSARTIALQEVKTALLNELGTHVSAIVKSRGSSDGRNYGSVQIETLSAGVTQVEILDEKWNGVTYALKAQIKADPAEVLKAINKMLDAENKQKEIGELNTKLAETQSQNIKISDELERIRKSNEGALAELVKLRMELAESRSEAARKSTAAEYQKQVKVLDVNAVLNLGAKYFSENKHEEAYKLWKQAAELGNSWGQAHLGWAYANGLGVGKDYAQSVYWYRKAAEQGNSEAQTNLAAAYAKGEGVEKDNAKALYWCRRAAEQGFAWAQTNLGGAYATGIGVEKDHTQAVYWFRKAAEQGDARAQNFLAFAYSTGQGIEKDYAQAVYWYRKGAEQGDAGAQNNLGIAYANGLGVEKDDAQAVFWFRKAAEQGNTQAQFRLGSAYGMGLLGVKEDLSQAVYWFRKGAEQGDAGAQSFLAFAYSTGQGVEKDYGQAVYWFRKAAEQGNSSGQAGLGVAYANGQGVTKDRSKAKYWLKKAIAQDSSQLDLLKDNADAGDGEAINALVVLEND